MVIPISAIREKQTPSIQAGATKIYRELLAYFPLLKIRKTLGLSRHEVAAKLAVSHTALLCLEARPDLLLSTLAEFVEKTGGQWSLTVGYPDHQFDIGIEAGNLKVVTR